MAVPFCYDLPLDRIAQRPVHPYDQAKMLVVDRAQGELEESKFSSISAFLRKEDLLVFNNTKVFPARLFGHFGGDGGQVELLLLEQRDDATWICLGRPLKRFKVGKTLEFSGELRAEVLERISSHHVLLRFSVPSSKSLSETMRHAGVMPIPPYIRRGVGDGHDLSDYQTFFAQHEGSVAAPTASLHFTPELLAGIKQVGCSIEYVTLHLGTASFLPLWNDGQELHQPAMPPGEERGFFDVSLLNRLREVKQRGGRVVAIGTSVVRLLETIARQDVQSSGLHEFRSNLFIEPGFDFKFVDALVTNFHQPRTTHLLLVQAFMGQQLLERSYEYALAHEFRFLSYGDGMLIV